MADHCCQGKAKELQKIRKEQSKVLWIVLAINLVMFVAEMTSGIIAKSLSLTGDSLDMLGDAIAYGSSLYVINMGLSAKAKSAMLKGGIMLASAIFVLSRAVYQFYYQTNPELTLMSSMGLVALIANGICLYLLTRHKSDDINMSSVWTCSRNDIIANTSILIAAGLVYLTRSSLPDLLVGLGITLLFARSALKVLSESRQVLISQK